MPDIQVEVSYTGNNDEIAVISARGFIDTTTAPDLEKKLEEQLALNKYKIVVNLENIDYVSSAGWGVFVSEIREIRENNGDLVLVNMSSDVYDVYELMAIPREENVFKLIHTAMKGDLKALKLARDFDNHNQVIYTLFALASSGKIRGLSPKQHLEIINAIGIIPGSTAKQRLGAIVARILTRRLPKE